MLDRVGLKAHARDSAGGLDGRVDVALEALPGPWVSSSWCAWRVRPCARCLCCAWTRPLQPWTPQDTIKRMFSDHRTTLTIAHRLDTVIESDKIAVLEQGVLQEFESPHALLSSPESMFSKLVDKSGASAAAALRQMAAGFFATRSGVLEERFLSCDLLLDGA